MVGRFRLDGDGAFQWTKSRRFRRHPVNARRQRRRAVIALRGGVEAAVSPLSWLMILTRAPATGAPVGSVTTPAMVPVGVCAWIEPAATNTRKKSFARLLLIVRVQV